MMRSVPIVLGCLLAFVAVALAQSNETAETANTAESESQDSTCTTYYRDSQFYMNCSIPDGTYNEINLSHAQWSSQV